MHFYAFSLAALTLAGLASASIDLTIRLEDVNDISEPGAIFTLTDNTTGNEWSSVRFNWRGIQNCPQSVCVVPFIGIGLNFDSFDILVMANPFGNEGFEMDLMGSLGASSFVCSGSPCSVKSG